jgi:hypothetical protein
VERKCLNVAAPVDGDANPMPTEILDPNLFVKLAEKAEACRVFRSEKQVKLKLRTPERLYTIKMEQSEADGFLKTLKCKIEELTERKKKKGRQESSSTPRETQEEQ